MAANPENLGLRSRDATLRYEFEEGIPNSGVLDFTKNKVNVHKLTKGKEESEESFVERVKFVDSLRTPNFLGNKFADPFFSEDKSVNEVLLVSEPYDFKFTAYADELKRNGISSYLFFEVPCQDARGGITYTQIHPTYRSIVSQLIQALFSLHEKKRKCTGGFTLDDVVVANEMVCFNITDFVDATPEGRASDMLCLKEILDVWFPKSVVSSDIIIHSSREVLKIDMKKLEGSANAQLGKFGWLPKETLSSPPSMSHLLEGLGKFHHYLISYEPDRVKSFFSNHIATMDPTQRLNFIKNCSDKSYSTKFSFSSYKAVLENIGNMNGWVREADYFAHGPLVNILNNDFVISGDEGITTIMKYKSQGLPYDVNRSLVSFWRNSGVHVKDHMPYHMEAKGKRMEDIQNKLLDKETKRLKKKANWKYPKRELTPRDKQLLKEEKERALKIFNDVDVELTIMSVYDKKITTLFNELFLKGILDAFI